MILSVINLPGIRFLVRIRRKDTNLVRLAHRDRSGLQHNDPVDLYSTGSCGKAASCSRCPRVKVICRLHHRRRSRNDRNSVKALYFRSHASCREICHVDVAGNVLRLIQHCTALDIHGNNQRNIFTNNIFYFGDILLQCFQDSIRVRSITGTDLRSTVCRLIDGTVAVCINFRNNHETLEFSHNRSCGCNKIRLIHIHSVKLERATTVHSHGLGLVFKSGSAARKTIIPVIISKAYESDLRDLDRVTPVINYLGCVSFHPSGSSLGCQLGVQRFLENRCKFKSVKCHFLVLSASSEGFCKNIGSRRTAAFVSDFTGLQPGKFLFTGFKKISVRFLKCCDFFSQPFNLAFIVQLGTGKVKHCSGGFYTAYLCSSQSLFDSCIQFELIHIGCIFLVPFFGRILEVLDLLFQVFVPLVLLLQFIQFFRCILLILLRVLQGLQFLIELRFRNIVLSIVLKNLVCLILRQPHGFQFFFCHTRPLLSLFSVITIDIVASPFFTACRRKGNKKARFRVLAPNTKAVCLSGRLLLTLNTRLPLRFRGNRLF
nr:MAG TPA: hypothetical protein [Caudoviricetes sp.]